ncbi:MAG: ribonuclease III [Phycisphaerae bacterium]
MQCEVNDLKTCQERLGYSFRDAGLLRAALTHASSADHRGDSNERMEFLGDSILGFVVCEALYEALPEAQEGDLTKIKSAVVSRAACAQAASRLGLAEAIVVGQGMESHVDLPKSIIAAALESVTAAIYLDGGMDAARAFVVRALHDEIEIATQSEHHFNYKSQLQQYAQRELNVTPRYEMLDEKGPDHAKCFEIAVAIGPERFQGAWGPSKKEAEQKAAKLALHALNQLSPES